MKDVFTSLKSDPKILDAMRTAARVKLSPAELFEQRVSFVYSGMSEKSGVTREQVRDMLSAHDSGQAVPRP